MRATIALLFTLTTSSAASAADWLTLAGTEAGRSGDVAIWGFAQLLVEAQPWSSPVTGLQAPPLAPFEGQRIAAELQDGFDVSLRRARLGTRGAVPGTQGALVFLGALEAGENALTRDRGIVVVDLSVTLTAIPYVKLRAGQFKLPTADEALENNPTTAATTRFSPYIAALLLEQHVVDDTLVGPADAFRDVGVQAFDAIPLWRKDTGVLELSYVAMASIGRPAHTFFLEDDDVAAHGAHLWAAGPDLTGRLQLSYVFDDHKRLTARRDELSVWAWRQQGGRAVVVEGVDALTPRVRQGAGAQVRAAGVRVRAEAVFAEGAVLQQGAFRGQPVKIQKDGVAHGGSLDLSVMKLGALDLAPFTIDATLDWLVRNPDDAVALRVLQGVTFGSTVALSPSFRLLVNAEFRRQLVGPDAPKDAPLIAAGLSPVISTQLALLF